jgi:phospholipase C
MRFFPAKTRAAPLGLMLAFIAGCSGNTAVSPVPPGAQKRVAMHRHASSNKIQHIVIIIQENRSFNNLFYGFPEAKTVKYGYDAHGKKIVLQPVDLETTWDIDHSSSSFFAACDGTGSIPGTNCRMDGFDNEYSGCGHQGQPPCPNANPPYSYVPHSETKPYFYLGKNYVLADRMFASNFDASSFVSHQYIIAGQASSSVNYPYSSWGCPGGSSDKINTVFGNRQIGNPIVACWDNQTLGDEMDDAGLTWGFYTATIGGDLGIWSAYQAISHIYNGPDWGKDVLTPQTTFFNDVQNGKLRALSWITPTWENSDHAGSGSNTGPSWVASLVNAIGESQYWDSTAIFIFWDDYGGWYDPIAPKMLDLDGLGLRIPMLIVSPYAKKGHVSHVAYEHGSILKFVEDTFGLPRLSASDTRANSPAADAFNFNKPPRKFKPVPSTFGIGFFKHQKTSHHIPDAQ